MEMNNTKATGSLVLGLVAIVLGVVFGPSFGIFASIISLILGIVGVILAIHAKKETGGVKGTSGLVCSIIGLITGAVFTVGCLAYGGFAANITGSKYGTYGCYGCIAGSCMTKNAVDNYIAEKEYDRTNQKNADEIAAQLQTCITEYDTEYDCLGSQTVIWDENGANCSNADFMVLINQNITTSVQSNVDGSYASAEIVYDSDTKMYTITVTLGEATATK